MSTNQRGASFPTLQKVSRRDHARVVLSPSDPVYARVRSRTTAATTRGVVVDLSAGGMGAQIVADGRIETPQDREEVTVHLEYEGVEAMALGRVVRTSLGDLSVRFNPATTDDMLNRELLALLAHVVTRRMERVDTERFAQVLPTAFAHEHFFGGGYLDVRIQAREAAGVPAWWQIVFLEYLVRWSAEEGLATGLLRRAVIADRAVDVLPFAPTVTSHPAPWSALLQLAGVIAHRGLLVASDQAESFRFVLGTLGDRR
jgi:hypothetical protein